MAHDETPAAVLESLVRELGGAPDHVEALPGGAVNLTHRVRLTTGDVVVRIPRDPLDADVFPVETWATTAAARSGIAVAPVLRSGRRGGLPYLVSEYVEPDPRPVVDPWHRLGRAARAVGVVPLDGAPPSLYSRFGADLPTSWRAHVEYNVRSLAGDDPLLQAGAYTSASTLRDVLGPLGTTAFDHGLAHGDLAPRNLLSRGPDRAPVLLDWGAAEAGPTPWTDARRVFAWATLDGAVTDTELAAFLAAAGIDSASDRRVLAAMTALHLLDVARWARDRRPDRYASSTERCRRGLVALGLSD